jgi:hypothetical protein
MLVYLGHDMIGLFILCKAGTSFHQSLNTYDNGGGKKKKQEKDVSNLIQCTRASHTVINESYIPDNSDKMVLLW